MIFHLGLHWSLLVPLLVLPSTLTARLAASGCSPCLLAIDLDLSARRIRNTKGLAGTKASAPRSPPLERDEWQTRAGVAPKLA